MKVPEHVPDWGQSSNVIGHCYHDGKKTRRAEASRSAGLTTYEAGYVNAANDYPRFERQRIRGIYDEGISSGTKVPHPEMLRRFPNREVPVVDSGDLSRPRPRSGSSTRSGVSGRSGRSGRSQGSRRSAASFAGSQIASSVASSGPPRGYMRQARPPVTMYTTSTDAYGAGGHVGPEPVHGREVWMLGRGGGQISSFDNCLVEKGAHVPLTRSN
eukprot:TRINITY_DN6213_c0_g6_i1.p2 TRINITY_DN6213_c0_g6~~TRINITY_DN6213_c0_g6_i1.p2  ORF type:complete len:214 (+),score=19.52 TRINITY_DN6213_c0_g6_i1:163-804(+)